ncbi:hypothetical protein [Ancylobacter mangrovi]|uniref:hypothetical protein n=1 Tax=Ancylobacter mangrovi TaxID=2972472 RepID=UPI00216224D0|nr:hypothetical protein [Ancylobacter mangrovi]MCS0501370.1 hypothetical protein [Ancylobacter mangrovi]
MTATIRIPLHRNTSAPAPAIRFADINLAGKLVELEVTPRAGGAPFTLSTAEGGLAFVDPDDEGAVDGVVIVDHGAFVDALPLGQRTAVDVYATSEDGRAKIAAGTITVGGTGEYLGAEMAVVQVPGLQGVPGSLTPEAVAASAAAVQAASVAASAEDGATSAKGEAEAARDASVTARDEALTARTGAEAAQDGANGARTAAEAARDQAQQAVANPSIAYDTLAVLAADLAHAAGTIGQVLGDGTNAGFYVKSGASGAGSWVKKSNATVPALGQQVASTLDALDTGQTNPHIFTDPLLLRFTPPPGSPTTWIVGAGGVLSVGNARGRRTGLLTTGNASVRTYRSQIAGDTFSFAITIENVLRPASGNPRILLRQFTAASAEIAGTRQTLANGLVTNPNEQPLSVSNIAIDPACSYVELFIDAGSVAGNSIEFSRISLAVGNRPGWRPALIRDRSVIHIDPAGDDRASGSPDSPVATPDRAMQMLARPDGTLAGEIILGGGDYIGGRFSLGYTGANIYNPVVGDLRIAAGSNARVRLIHGMPFTSASWAKSAGYANIYEAAIAYAPVAKFIFEHDTPFSAIAMAERFPQHRGRQYRSPSLPMRKAASLAALDAAPGCWLYAGGKLYIHAPGSADPTASGRTYYVPPNLVTNLSGGVNYAVPQKTGYLEIHGIEVCYAYSGFVLANVARWRLSECVSLGAATTGFQGSNSSGVREMCAAIANTQDGFGDHDSLNLEAASYRDQGVLDRFLYSALNGDDGWSNHERCNATAQECLSEYNDDGGFLPAGGAHLWASHCIAHRNGQGAGIDGAVGEGFGNRGGPDGNEGGVSTDATLIDCIAIGNVHNFASGAAAAEQMRCIRPLSIDPVSTHYRQLADSSLMLVDPRISGAGTPVSGTASIVTTEAPA